MIKEILIALVAVVVVILIIAFAALRFLRADDSDAFDDLPDEPRKQSRSLADSQPMPAPGQRQRPARPEPARDQQPRSLPRNLERTSDERAPAGYRDRDKRAGSSERRSQGTGQRVPVAASRGARPAREADPDSQVTASWDAMSDVDYWAELAADKPFTAPSPTPAGPGPASRRGPDAKPDRKPPEIRPAARRDQPAQLPVRQRTQPRAPEPASQSIAALARLGAQPPASSQPRTGPRPAASRPPQAPPPAPVSYPGAQGRLPLPLDDDPLTSPSFPAINTSDSRSYRTRQPRSQHAGPQQDSGRDRAGYRQPGQVSQPAQQFPGSPPSDRSASAPNGYPVQAPAPAPAANPYGSFVGTSQAGYSDPATGHLDSLAYGTGYAGPSQPSVPDPSWYSPADGNGGGGNSTSYYDTSYPGTEPGGSAPNGAGAADAGYTSNGYAGTDYYDSYGESAYPGGYPAAAFPAAGYAAGAFQGGQPDPAGYPAQGQVTGHYEQRAIGAPDLTYGHDGYQGYPGYGGNAR